MRLEAKVLETDRVRLEPLGAHHGQDLEAVCNADVDVFESLYPVALFGPHFEEGFARLLEAKNSGASIPFAVIAEGRVVGVTSYLALDPVQSNVEIGGTFYGPLARGGLVNPSAKRLLLGHAFEAGCRRVTFRVDALNVRSRAAVQKLGATYEGVLRQDRVVWTGRIRDTAIYSILASEWPGVMAALDVRLAPARASSPRAP